MADKSENVQLKSAVRCEGLTKVFGSVVANDNINLDVRYGEILALLGENGSGKTTLMNMLSGIYHPDHGSIYVSDELVSIKSPEDSIKLGIGMIHQHFKLVDVFSAMDNIVTGTKGKLKKKSQLKNELNEICKELGLAVNPEEKVYNMSVSEKQTVEIMKVLYRGAKILILDEATSSVDTRTEQHINKGMDALMENRTTFVIAHRLSTIRNSDAIMVLENGEIIERGTHEELLGLKQRYYELYTGIKELE
mgnify:CR=1 FL=1